MVNSALAVNLAKPQGYRPKSQIWQKLCWYFLIINLLHLESFYILIVIMIFDFILSLNSTICIIKSKSL